MLSSIPPPPLITSALGLGLDAYVTVRASLAAGVADARAAFELTLSAPSPDWGFLVLAGLEPLIDALERLRARVDDLDWLESVGAIDLPTRRRIAESRFACNVDSAPEGSVVFPGEPVLVVEGPYWQAQLVRGLVESAITDATLVATRFARLSLASGGADLVEIGAATAHRLGGAPLLARAAYVGGARATTSALAGRRYGLPVIAMQPAGFDLGGAEGSGGLVTWLASAPSGSVVRVDPIQPETSIHRIALAFKELARHLDTGWDDPTFVLELPSADSLRLAARVSNVFAGAGISVPPLLVSGEVDEKLVLELRALGSPVRAFGVRAGGIAESARLSRYTLVAIEQDSAWSSRLQVGEDVASSSDPGRKLLARYVDGDDRPVADVAHTSGERLVRPQGGRFVDRVTGFETRLDASTSASLRTSVMRAGRRVSPPEPPPVLRQRAIRAIGTLDESYRRIVAPARYPVGLSPHLASLKSEILAQALE
jgi:nicotinate phosphoribosyltransferase